jgi:hypothetical protein
MPQTMTSSPATQGIFQTLRAVGCPAWCTDGQHGDGSPHFGGMVNVELSLDEPLVSVSGEPLNGTGWLDACLMQQQDGDSPVISMTHNTWELPDMTIAEAEQLAYGILQLVQRAHGRTAAAA